MNETALQILAIVKLLVPAGFAILYAIGGMAGTSKGIRRIGGPIWIGLAISIISLWQKTFSAVYLLYPALLIAALSLGYGGDSLPVKLRKRAIYGLALGIAALPIAIKTANWVMFGFHVALCISSSVVFGVFNPLRSARDEETIIAALSTVIPVFMV